MFRLKESFLLCQSFLSLFFILFHFFVFSLQHLLAFLYFLNSLLFLLLNFFSILILSSFIALLTKDYIVGIAWSRSCPKSLLGRLLLNMPKDLDKSVVQNSFCTIESCSSFICISKGDESRTRITLKLNLYID